MAQTLAIWKWRTAWPLRFESRVMDSLGRDEAPFALMRFNAEEFAQTIRDRFGDGDEAPFTIDVCNFTGHRANWLILSAGWSVPQDAIAELLTMCAAHGLHIYSAG